MPEDFARARQANIGRKGRRRFLHIIGKPATGDRNGTMVLMHAMQPSRVDFELVVRCQQQLQPLLRDRRISWDFSAPEEQWKLYEGFDLMIMARRYGGLCLPLAESLTSGLPTLMSNVFPNNELLPADWLISGEFRGGFTARVPIQYFKRQRRGPGSHVGRVGGHV